MTTEVKLQHYELMLIFTPILSEDEYKAAQQKYIDLVTNSGGIAGNANPWGMKSLAYPIQKKTTGLYFVLEFQAGTDFNTKLEVQINRDETVMRHMVTKLDKYAVIYNNRHRGAKAENKADATNELEPQPIETTNDLLENNSNEDNG
ncbi:MAG: 30S ribosomal protein S6 [Chitinophagia bacterium]|nr:30S ribosomal protein S6 [Chitinophagia bacterium]